jgi:WXG100 family type VII secretion target
MSEFAVQPDELRRSAGDFDQAGKDIAEVIKKLDDSTGELEKKWEGASRQVFFKQYKQMRGYIEAISSLMANISTEMKAMADRYEEADR